MGCLLQAQTLIYFLLPFPKYCDIFNVISYTVGYNLIKDFDCGHFVEKNNIIMGFDCICNFESRPLQIWHIACWSYLGFILKALKFKSTGNLSSLEYKFEAHELMPMDMWNSINHKCIHTKENVKMSFILNLSSNFFHAYLEYWKTNQRSRESYSEHIN